MFRIGSHWEERILQTELMQPVVNGGQLHISPLTLALFEDSGWYTANYVNTGRYVKGARVPSVFSVGVAFGGSGLRYGIVRGVVVGMTWGYKQGCNFATQKCLSDTQQPLGNPPHFLNATTASYGCMIDLYEGSERDDLRVLIGARVSCASVCDCVLRRRRHKGYDDGGLISTAMPAPFRYPAADGSHYYSSNLAQRDYCPSWCVTLQNVVCLTSCRFPPSVFLGETVVGFDYRSRVVTNECGV